jgi:SAM-dependent methyltransferase
MGVNHVSDWSRFLEASDRSLFSQAKTHALLLERVMIEVPRGGRILEAGCGLAFLSKLLSDAGYAMTAGDIDTDVLEAARTSGLSSPAVSFVKADLFALADGHAGRGYDAIIHSGVLEHFSDNEIVSAFEQQRQIAAKLIFKIPNVKTKMTPAHFGNERFLTNSAWVDLAKRGGYTSVRIYGGDSLPNWTQVLPAALHQFPKAGQQGKRLRLFDWLSAWRKYVSRHTVFVCE